MDIIENLKKEKTKWENKIYGVGETRIDLMIEDVIRELQKYQNELEKKDIQIIKIREFLEKEQLELHDYDDSHDLSCEGKGRMYLVDELLEEYFTNKAENVGE